MFWEKKFHHWVKQMRSDTRLPVRVRLWNGSQFDLGISAPEVTIRIPSPSSLIYLLNPSLESLGRAYVEGKLEVEGRLQAIIEVANVLSEKGLATGSRLGQLFKPRAHTRGQDKSAIEYHYDVSNEFYQSFLDPTMVYSCAYFEQGTEDLLTAQQKKSITFLPRSTSVQGIRYWT